MGEGIVDQAQDPKYEKNGFLRGYKTAVRGEYRSNTKNTMRKMAHPTTSFDNPGAEYGVRFFVIFIPICSCTRA